MKVMFVISSLQSGGAERVLSSLAGDLAERGINVEVVTFSKSDTDFYKLSQSVVRIELDLLRQSGSTIDSIKLNFNLIARLRAEIKKSSPDVVVSFMDGTNIISCIACVGIDVKLVVSERTDPFVRRLSPFRQFIRPFLYKYVADKVVVQTNNVKKKAALYWKGVNVDVVPNPIAADFESVISQEREKVVLSVGRLIESKAHPVAILAFKSVFSDFPDWRLKIAGEGPLYAELASCIDDAGLGQSVTLLGPVKDISGEYRNASVFLMTSRYEGFPNALLEAACSGCACISSNCQSGPDEILFEPDMGLLVPVDDVDEFSKALRRVISDAEFRHSLQKGVQKVRDRFSRSAVVSKWLDVIA